MSETLEDHWRHVSAARRVVVKIGSSLLTAGSNGLDEAWINGRCQEIAQLMKEGREVVVVTSGAVAAGTPRLGLGRRPANLREKQAAAAAGQGVLMGRYEAAFSRFGLHVAQVLLTRDDCHHRRRYLNARDTLMTLLELKLVPVVNENDTVMTLELRFGDNDTLAANVVDLVEADLLILLSDVEGLFEADPRVNAKARPVALVPRVNEEVEKLAGGVGSEVASGGMVTKLKAAKMAARRGCPTILASGRREDPILSLLHGTPVGTLFLAEDSPMKSRKRWIANSLHADGSLFLDEGAVRALVAGNSLLAKGVKGVEGAFDRGSAVQCRDSQGRVRAKGLVNYSSGHLSLIAGKHTLDFEKILGFVGDAEVIHRDNLVILE